MGSPTPLVRSFFHKPTSTVSHLAIDEASGEAAIVDPVLDFEPANGRTATSFTDSMLAALAERGARLRWVLETHLHADHLSAAGYLRDKTGARVVTGNLVGRIQSIFKPLFGADDVTPDGSAFDLLVGEGDRLPLGQSAIEAMHTPGHTAACITFRVGEAAFIGDTLFADDYGTARTDFPTGDPATLYRSIQRILALPARTRLFLCHDYAPAGRAETIVETSAGSARGNVHLARHPTEAEYVAFRVAQNKTLGPPRLLAASVQVNIRGGRMPPPDAEGRIYLRIPVDRL